MEGAGQALRWVLWCSAQTPLQDGDDDSLHGQFCLPKTYPYISEGPPQLQVFPWMLTKGLVVINQQFIKPASGSLTCTVPEEHSQ